MTNNEFAYQAARGLLCALGCAVLVGTCAAALQAPTEPSTDGLCSGAEIGITFSGAPVLVFVDRPCPDAGKDGP